MKVTLFLLLYILTGYYTLKTLSFPQECGPWYSANLAVGWLSLRLKIIQSLFL